MHELSLVAALFETLEEKAREHRAARITVVRLKVGKLSGAVPELLESAFETYKKGTIADGARLEIEEVPVRLRCRSCGGERLDVEGSFACLVCGGRDVELLEGRDLVVERIELEADEPPSSS
ncbi:MAG: hydrogenase maturation nickel metallochaperone HypA [Candidatus Aminicenantes bacterium]|nr:hydrogenase maturation nickel metallochaperone HypA [Candidatus Aminicenantes bacterium]